MKKIIENDLEDKMIKEKKAKTTGKTKKWYENLRKIFGRDDFYMDCFKKDDK